MRKAMTSSGGASGGQFYPIRLATGTLAWGTDRYARLEGEGLQTEGHFEPAYPCLASKAVGEGFVFYCGAELGKGAARDDQGLAEILDRLEKRAGIHPVLGAKTAKPGALQVGLLSEGGKPRFLTLHNPSGVIQSLTLELKGKVKGIFSQREWSLDGEVPLIIPAGLTDIFTIES